MKGHSVLKGGKHTHRTLLGLFVLFFVIYIRYLLHSNMLHAVIRTEYNFIKLLYKLYRADGVGIVLFSSEWSVHVRAAPLKVTRAVG